MGRFSPVLNAGIHLTQSPKYAILHFMAFNTPQFRLCKACKQTHGPHGGYCSRCFYLKRRFRIKPEDIITLRRQQVDHCAICDKPAHQNAFKALTIDHDHESGVVRGLLCTGCNLGLSYFHSPELLQAALTYLGQPPPDFELIPRRKPVSITRGALNLVLADESLKSLRKKARKLAELVGITEDAALSRIRRELGVTTKKDKKRKMATLSTQEAALTIPLDIQE